MAEVIARMRSELQDRLKEIEGDLRPMKALMAEKARLEQALSIPPFAERLADQEPVTRQAPAKGKRARKRAPRGANKTAVLEAVRNMPGASSGEIATASGVDRAQVYNLLRAALEKGDLVTVDLGGGQKGYRVNAEPETAFPASNVSPGRESRGQVAEAVSEAETLADDAQVEESAAA